MKVVVKELASDITTLNIVTLADQHIGEKNCDQRYVDKARQDTLVLENLNANGKLTKLNSKLVIKCMLEENLNGEVNELEEAIKYQTEVSHALDDHIREVSQRRRD